MYPSLKRFRLLALALVAAVVLVACGEGSGGTPGAATVNGTTITQTQLDDAIPEFQFLSSLSQQPCGTPTQGESADSACARFALSNLVQEQIVGDYASANDITLADGRVAGTIGDLEQQMGGPAELDSVLKENDLTRTGLSALAQRLLLFQEVQSVISEDSITDAQIRQAYEEQKATFTTIHAKHVLVKDEKTAQEVAGQATEKNFAELAQEFSTDPGSAKNGGDLGELPASQLDPTFVKGALALEPGQISQPIETQFGWHVILLVEAIEQPLDEVRAQLAQQLSTTSFSDWFSKQLADADVSINPRYGTFDTATGAINPIRSTIPGEPAQLTGPSGSQPVNGSPGAGTATGATGGAGQAGVTGPTGPTGAAPAP